MIVTKCAKSVCSVVKYPPKKTKCGTRMHPIDELILLLRFEFLFLRLYMHWQVLIYHKQG